MLFAEHIALILSPQRHANLLKSPRQFSVSPPKLDGATEGATPSAFVFWSTIALPRLEPRAMHHFIPNIFLILFIVDIQY